MLPETDLSPLGLGFLSSNLILQEMAPRGSRTSVECAHLFHRSHSRNVCGVMQNGWDYYTATPELSFWKEATVLLPWSESPAQFSDIEWGQPHAQDIVGSKSEGGPIPPGSHGNDPDNVYRQLRHSPECFHMGARAVSVPR